MTRILTTAIKTELPGQKLRLAMLVKINFSTPVYYTTWSSPLTHNSNTYTPGVGLIGVSDLPESINLKIDTIQIELTGANQSSISVALSENYADVEVNIYKVLLDSNYAIVADPIQHDFLLDTYDIDENPAAGVSRITWIATNHFGAYLSKGGRRSNDADQQLHFPGDKGLEFSGEKITDLKWGRA